MTQILVLVPTMLMDFSCNRHAIHYIHGDLIHCCWHLRMDQNMDQNISNIKTYKLVGGLEHVLFLHILGMSSSQLTNSYFFQTCFSEGLKSPTSKPVISWLVFWNMNFIFHFICGIIPTPMMEFKMVMAPPTREGWKIQEPKSGNSIPHDRHYDPPCHCGD